jgi:type I restriction enzyme, S subunit
MSKLHQPNVMTRLGDCVTIQNGYAFASEHFNQKQGTPLIRIRDLITQNPVTFFDSTYPPEFLVKSGDLIIGMDGEFKAVRWGGPGSLLNQRVCRLLIDPTIIDLGYLSFCIRAPLKKIEDETPFTTVKHLSSKLLADIRLILPNLSVQRRIAATLDSQLATIAEARQAAERRVKAAADMELALFREFFHGITPVVIGAPKEQAPAGWTWQRLTKLADLESGHTPSRRQPDWWGGEIPWIALPDIRALDGKVAMETKENTNPKGIANSSARILSAGTVMLSRTASVGFVAMMGRPMATSQDFVNWVCGSGLAPRFLMHALRSSREYLLANASGAIHQTIYMPAVKEFHLCLPDRRRQDQLTAQLDSQLADAATVLAAARAELAAIQALPAAVLRRVFAPIDVMA